MDDVKIARGMLHAVSHHRRSLLAGAARAIGVRQIRHDPALFSHLLELAATENEEAIRREHRFEDFLDEAVRFAHRCYHGTRRDRALLILATHTERLMERLFQDRSWTSFLATEDLHPPPRTLLWRSRSLVERYAELTSR